MSVVDGYSYGSVLVAWGGGGCTLSAISVFYLWCSLSLVFYLWCSISGVSSSITICMTLK